MGVRGGTGRDVENEGSRQTFLLLFGQLLCHWDRRSPHKVRLFRGPNASLNGTFIIRLPIQHIVLIAIQGHSALSASELLSDGCLLLTKRAKGERVRRACVMAQDRASPPSPLTILRTESAVILDHLPSPAL